VANVATVEDLLAPALPEEHRSIANGDSPGRKGTISKTKHEGVTGPRR
jgi:hypothetical protein